MSTKSSPDSSPPVYWMIVIGGGDVTKLDNVPPVIRVGNNTDVLRGGILLWDEDGQKD